MKFFSLDCHIGIRDVKSIFENLGHKVDIKSISGHLKFANGLNTVDREFLINAQSWQKLDKSLIDRFYNENKDYLKSYDCFISFYPPSFSMLYENFNKKIISIFPIRFDVPFQNNPHLMNEYIFHLRRCIDSGKLIPIANNIYDKKRCEEIIERDVFFIPSLCNYNNCMYNPKKENSYLLNHSKNINIKIDKIKTIKNYTIEEYYSYLGIVHIPYHNTIMSLFEQYSSCVPLFFPSDELLLDLWKGNLALNEVSWYGINNIKFDPGKMKYFTKKIEDINFLNEKSICDLIKLSDWNNSEYFKHVQKFNSIEELNKIANMDMKYFKNISSLMEKEKQIRERKIENLWKEILKKI